MENSEDSSSSSDVNLAFAQKTALAARAVISALVLLLFSMCCQRDQTTVHPGLFFVTVVAAPWWVLRWLTQPLAWPRHDAAEFVAAVVVADVAVAAAAGEGAATPAAAFPEMRLCESQPETSQCRLAAS